MISIVLEQQSQAGKTAVTGLAGYGAYKLSQDPTARKFASEALERGKKVFKAATEDK